MEPVSVRLDTREKEFVENSDFSFSQAVREFVKDQRVKHAAGRCAACPSLVYTGDGHTFVDPQTPLGQLFDVDPRWSFDLCATCGEQAYDALSNEDVSPPELRTVDVMYAAERKAIADAQPDTLLESLADGPNPGPDSLLALLLLWATESDDKIEPNDLVAETGVDRLEDVRNAVEGTHLGDRLKEHNIL